MDNISNKLPIIEVTRETLPRLWQTINGAIKNASFIAIDCELSGLGNRKKLNFSEIDLRYRNTAEIAGQYSVISLGLSCFTLKSVSSIDLPEESSKGNCKVQSQDYLVQTFNILTLCDDYFMVETLSLKFLLSHGFDFNKLYAEGVLYKRGNDSEVKKASPCVRDIFAAILRHRKPLVFHNGFVDLVFTYQNFYLDLPKNIEMFASDLVDMFPAGIYDTKYIVEYFQKLPATYLEFIFKKMQLRNDSRRKNGDWHVHLSFPPYPATVAGLNWYPYCQILEMDQTQIYDTPLCPTYKFHGNCSKGESCEGSHDIDRIVRELNNDPKKQKKSAGIIDTSVAQVIQMKAQEQKGQNTPPHKVRRRTHRKKSGQNSENEEMETDLHSEEGKNSCEAEVSEEISPPDVEMVSKHSEQNGSHVQSNFKPKQSNSSGHRAGFDAFMTGYIFASQISQLGALTTDGHNFTPEDVKMSHVVNRVYLFGKEFPFLVKRANYAKKSLNHQRKIETIREES